MGIKKKEDASAEALAEQFADTTADAEQMIDDINCCLADDASAGDLVDEINCCLAEAAAAIETDPNKMSDDDFAAWYDQKLKVLLNADRPGSVTFEIDGEIVNGRYGLNRYATRRDTIFERQTGTQRERSLTACCFSGV